MFDAWKRRSSIGSRPISLRSRSLVIRRTWNGCCANSETSKESGYVVILDARIASAGPKRVAAEPRGSRARPAGGRNRPAGSRQTRDSGGRRFLELLTPIKTSGTGMSADLETMFELAAGNTVAGHIRAGIEQTRY